MAEIEVCSDVVVLRCGMSDEVCTIIQSVAKLTNDSILGRLSLGVATSFVDVPVFHQLREIEQRKETESNGKKGKEVN